MKLLEKVGLSDRYLQYPAQLSGGQKQRVAIARAMAMDPEALLLDEPTSALDPTMVDEVNAVIRDLASSGMTIVIVTHDMSFARDISTRVFYMDEGIIYEEGTPEEIFEHPKKPKTVQFIKKLFLLEEEITSRHDDFTDLTKRVFELMVRTNSYGIVWNNAILVLDEVIHQMLFPLLADPFRICLKMECGKNRILLNLDYSGPEVDLAAVIREKAATFSKKDAMDDWQMVSAKVICGYTSEIRYTAQEGSLPNHLEIEVRNK
jgi:polar amino acid transport system ATP-binding protein